MTLTVTDENGNTDQCTATVTVEDNIDPTAICQDITINSTLPVTPPSPLPISTTGRPITVASTTSPRYHHIRLYQRRTKHRDPYRHR
ncbi:hypothetical protein HZ996_10685 [Cryomorphaceae bacterium]|nr:hypothetical protein HZ996_10685 [Cryomorphaceae bacterium]